MSVITKTCSNDEPTPVEKAICAAARNELSTILNADMSQEGETDQDVSDRGNVMLQVRNAVSNQVAPDLAELKADLLEFKLIMSKELETGKSDQEKMRGEIDALTSALDSSRAEAEELRGLITSPNESANEEMHAELQKAFDAIKECKEFYSGMVDQISRRTGSGLSVSVVQMNTAIQHAFVSYSSLTYHSRCDIHRTPTRKNW